jgi:hypothetical protein
MLADRVVLRRRDERDEQPRLSPEGIAAIKAARQRQAARNRKLKSAASPGTTRRTSHG